MSLLLGLISLLSSFLGSLFDVCLCFIRICLRGSISTTITTGLGSGRGGFASCCGILGLLLVGSSFALGCGLGSSRTSLLSGLCLLLLGIVSLLLFRIALITIGLILAVFLGVSILLLGILSLFLVGLLVFVFFLFLILSGLLIVILLLLLSGLVVVLILLFLVIFFLLFVGRGIGCILGSTSSSAASTRCLLGLGLVFSSCFGGLCLQLGISGRLLLLSIGSILVCLSLFLVFVGLLALIIGSLLLGFDAVLGLLCSSLDFFGSLSFLIGDVSVSLCTFLGSSHLSSGSLCTAITSRRRATWSRSTTAAAVLRTHLLTEISDNLVHLLFSSTGWHLDIIGGGCLISSDVRILGSVHVCLDLVGNLLNLYLLLILSRSRRGILLDVNLAVLIGVIKPKQCESKLSVVRSVMLYQ